MAETETETDKKMGCIGLCEVVHIPQRQITTQIPIEFRILVIGLGPGLGLGLGLGHCQSDRAVRFTNLCCTINVSPTRELNFALL